MEVNKSAWEKLRKQIEYHTQQDSEITDVHINYQVKQGKKNYLKLNIIKVAVLVSFCWLCTLV